MNYTRWTTNYDPPLNTSLIAIKVHIWSTHVANPARTSVKNREFFLSFEAPENSNLNHLPKALCATLRLKRSAHVMLTGR